VVGSSIKAFGPVLTTDPSPSGPITTYSGGQAAPPASGVPGQ
jgi:hypothetical protein